MIYLYLYSPKANIALAYFFYRWFPMSMNALKHFLHTYWASWLVHPLSLSSSSVMKLNWLLVQSSPFDLTHLTLCWDPKKWVNWNREEFELIQYKIKSDNFHIYFLNKKAQNVSNVTRWESFRKVWSPKLLKSKS